MSAPTLVGFTVWVNGEYSNDMYIVDAMTEDWRAICTPIERHAKLAGTWTRDMTKRRQRIVDVSDLMLTKDRVAIFP